LHGETCEVQLDNGSRILATNHANLSLHEPTCISLRPEQAKFVQTDEPISGNRFDTTVIECIYHGDHMRLSLDTGNQHSFMVKVPSSSLHSQLSGGQRVTVSFSADDCRALRTQ
jgi:putative spermidine/putrescine transport system ATP-binding protein